MAKGRYTKKLHIDKYGAHCERCGWSPPQIKKNYVNMLELHHIIPLRCRGEHSEDNCILLCPNHHRIAHSLGSIKDMRTYSSATHDYRWFGCKNKEELLRELERIDALV